MRGDLLASEHGHARKQALPAAALILVIVDELECTFPQFEYGDIGRSAVIQGAASAKDRKNASGVAGAASNDLVQRHS